MSVSQIERPALIQHHFICVSEVKDKNSKREYLKA